jgi:hypothetical protein
MPRDAFPEDLEVGATYVAEDEAGEGVTLTVVEVEGRRGHGGLQPPLAARC